MHCDSNLLEHGAPMLVPVAVGALERVVLAVNSARLIVSLALLSVAQQTEGVQNTEGVHSANR